MLSIQTQIRINMIYIKDYINMRLSDKRYSTNVAYHNVRSMNIHGGTFQSVLRELDETFDFKFEPCKDVLIKFKEKYLDKS